ncbi:MAG: hypothetical protein Q4Q58_06860 [Thermoplasmata archaeon]|nr:hypothetical protein [Thermoplasmata archaeon]
MRAGACREARKGPPGWEKDGSGGPFRGPEGAARRFREDQPGLCPASENNQRGAEFTIDTDLVRIEREALGEVVSKQQRRFEDVNSALPFVKYREAFLDVVARMIVTPGSIGRYAGLVFAGYGDREHFPSMHEYRVSGLFRTGLHHGYEKGTIINSSTKSWIEPFAQSDVIQSYLYGINEDLQRIICDAVSRILNDVTAAFIDATSMDSMRTGFEKMNAQLVESFTADVNGYTADVFMGPVKDSIAFLSKDEIATLAESLIKLTSLRRRASDEYETVGGPVDVAVISKHEGFVWISRKQYFNLILNPQYARQKEMMK